MEKYDVVIVGSGFGALAAAKSLGKAGVDFSLISSSTEHLFQPLLYQAATGMLSTREIAPPSGAFWRSTNPPMSASVALSTWIQIGTRSPTPVPV